MTLEEPQAHHTSVIVDGKRLEVAEYPSPNRDAPAIVLLHEGLGSISMWRNFPLRLAQLTGSRVIAYSRYGHGRSDAIHEPRPVDFMHHEAEVVLPEFLERMAAHQPILLGHSDGGSIALFYAAVHPGAVKALILEAPHVFVEELTVRSIAKLRDAYGENTSQGKTGLRAKLARHHDHPDEMFHTWTEIWLDPSFRNWNIEDRLEAVRCPLLLIQGQEDQYGTQAQIEAITGRISHATTQIMPDCGHSLHRDQPDATLKAICEFVSKLN
jgi:pimeloyl-ACP methyl ester carboxylesterase